MNEVAPPVKMSRETTKSHPDVQIIEPRVVKSPTIEFEVPSFSQIEAPSVPTDPEFAAYTINTRIKHDAYGEGVIVGSEIKPSGIHIIEVLFDNGNKNQFQLDVVVNARLMHLAKD